MRGLQVDDRLTEAQDFLVQVLLLLDDLLPPVNGTLKLIYDGVVGGVCPRCPLQTLRDAKLLAVDLVQYRRQRRRYSVAQHLEVSAIAC